MADVHERTWPSRSTPEGTVAGVDHVVPFHHDEVCPVTRRQPAATHDIVPRTQGSGVPGAGGTTVTPAGPTWRSSGVPTTMQSSTPRQVTSGCSPSSWNGAASTFHVDPA